MVNLKNTNVNEVTREIVNAKKRYAKSYWKYYLFLEDKYHKKPKIFFKCGADINRQDLNNAFLIIDNDCLTWNDDKGEIYDVTVNEAVELLMKYISEVY